MHLQPDSQLGQYRIIRELGHGGMGQVYEVEHRVLRKRYAQKLLPEDFTARLDSIARFEREAQVMAALEHPNIVKVDEFGENDGRYWLRMELVKGIKPGVVTLGEYAKERGGKLDQDEYAPILKQILEALAYAHDKGVVHRDLKPGNILLEKDEQGGIKVKVSDFGLARVIGEEFIRTQAQISITRSMQMTAGAEGQNVSDGPTLQIAQGTTTRALLGTWEYMSPEQKEAGKDVDARSDVYSLGLMTYRLLTGKELGLKAASRLVKGLKPQWDELIEKATEQDSQERYHSGSAMLTAFGEAFGGVSVETVPRQQVGGVVRASSVLLVLLVLVASLSAWRFWPKDREHAAQPPGQPIVQVATNTALEAAKNSPRAETNVYGALATRAREAGLIQQGEDQAIKQVTPRFGPEPAHLLKPGERWTNSLEQVFVSVPGTEVLFCIWDTRVKDYAAYVSENSAVNEDWKEPGFTQTEAHPVVNVSWDDAQAFCRWLTEKERKTGIISARQSYRLPKDWEWSVAVGLNESKEGTPKSKDTVVKQYPWGTDWPPNQGAGNYDKSLNVDGYDHTSPVAAFKPNQFGLFDMGGNVWQWCDDLYSGNNRVLRGAAWVNLEPHSLLTSARLSYEPNARINGMGFRCVLDGVSDSPSLQTNAKPILVQPEPSSAPTAAKSGSLGNGNKRWTNSLGQVFVPVPGTEVLFCIWDTRVIDFQKFVNLTGYQATKNVASYRNDSGDIRNGKWERNGDTWKSPRFEQRPEHPVCGVSWEDANAYCEWLTKKERAEKLIPSAQSYRLPKDWEWSVAVGLDENKEDKPFFKNMRIRNFPWDVEQNSFLWQPPKGAGNYSQILKVDDYERTSPVAAFKSNRFGLYDMGGNVRQWCEDRYDEDQDDMRVVRGSSWFLYEDDSLVCSRRFPQCEKCAFSDLGFRCVLADSSSR